MTPTFGLYNPLGNSSNYCWSKSFDFRLVHLQFPPYHILEIPMLLLTKFVTILDFDFVLCVLFLT